MKKLRPSLRVGWSIATIGFAWLVSVTAFGSQPIMVKDTVNVALQLELPETIVIGQSFRMIFSVQINQAVTHFNSQPDKISILVPQCFQVDSGETKWTGRLENGSSVRMTLLLRAIRPCREFLEGTVYTGCFKENPTVYKTTNRITSQVFQIGDSAATGTNVVYQDSSGITVLDTYEEGPPPSFTSGSTAIKQHNNQRSIHLDSLRGGKAVVSYLRNVENYLRISSGSHNEGAQERPLVPKWWKFSAPKCKIEVRNDSLLRLDLDRSCDTVRLQMELEGDTVSVLFKLLSNSVISGYFMYTNNFGVDVPGSGILAEVLHFEDGEWILDDAVITPADGRFELSAQIADWGVWVRLNFWSWNNTAIVPYASGQCWTPQSPTSVYLRRIESGNFTPGETTELAVDYTTITNLDWAGAFNICSWLQKGADYIESRFGASGHVIVVWGRNCNAAQSSYARNSWADITVNGVVLRHYFLQIKSKGSGVDWDEWDESIILHEFGHHFQNMFVDFPDSSSGSHFYYAPIDDQSIVNEHIAFKEAWAHIFQGLVLLSGQHVNRDNNSEIISIYDFEQPDPDVPYCLCPNGEQVGPSSTGPWWDGAQTEGAIVAALWDIYDFDDDGDFWIGGDLYGHNADYNSTTSWVGSDALFDAYLNYDPSLSDTTHEHPWDIYEFQIAWQQLGYPTDNTFRSIMDAHSISACTWHVGDANGDGVWAISDAQYILRVIYENGPAPVPHPIGSGDANCSGGVSISESVYLIAYIFGGDQRRVQPAVVQIIFDLARSRG